MKIIKKIYENKVLKELLKYRTPILTDFIKLGKGRYRIVFSFYDDNMEYAGEYAEGEFTEEELYDLLKDVLVHKKEY